jgi:hypothetical protein
MTVPSALVTTVNTAACTSREYTDAVTRWPSRRSIWSRLQSRGAKENFVRYIVQVFDPTNTRAYQSFTGRCTGFATQMYVRYNDSGVRVSRRTEREFARMGVQRRLQGERIPRKLRMPIFVVIRPGHAFNAVLVQGGTGVPGVRLDNFLFVFPQTDNVCQSSHVNLRSQLTVGILSVCRAGLAGGSYRFDYIVDFIKTGVGNVYSHRLTAGQRICYNNVGPVIFRAENPQAYSRVVSGAGHTFESYVRSALSGCRPTALDFRLVFTLLAGRMFRRRPGGPQERLTVQILHQLTGW